jgi:hypothetical protein
MLHLKRVCFNIARHLVVRFNLQDNKTVTANVG